MCNYVHEYHKPIPKKGIGYKLFLCDQSNNLIGLFSHQPYLIDRRCAKGNEWVEFDSHDFHKESGFCFFLTEGEALSCRELISPPKKNDTLIIKIQYNDGICKQWEDKMIFGEIFNTALCKKFRPVKGWSKSGKIMRVGGDIE